MNAYVFGLRYEDGDLLHTGDAQEVDVSNLEESVKESLLSGKVVRLDSLNPCCVWYYHIDKASIEQIYLGFWLASNYKSFFEEMKKTYSKEADDNTV